MVGGQFTPRAIQHEVNFPGSQAPGDRSGVQGGNPSPDDGEAIPNRDRLTQIDLAQEGGCRDHPLGLFALDPEGMNAGRNAARHADRVIALLEQRSWVLDR